MRFDAVYHGHFKCNRCKLSEMPVLWAYARDLFCTPGFGDTIDFDHIKRHSTWPRLAGWPPLRQRHPTFPTAAE